MNAHPSGGSSPPTSVEMPPLHSELRLLPDGRVLVHNLTPAFARFLASLGFADLRSSADESSGVRIGCGQEVSSGLPPAKQEGAA